MEANKARELCIRLLKAHDLGSWKFGWLNTQKLYGRCCHTRKAIQLSLPFVNRHTLEQVEEVIVHEIAHALCGPGYGHGGKWKEMCLQIGCKPHQYNHDSCMAGKPFKGDNKQ